MTFKVPQKWIPKVYQEQGVKLLVSPTGGGLFLKPGLGKTAMMLAAFKILKKAGLVRTMLVLAPLRVAQLTWPEEIESWADFNEFTYTILHGPDKDLLLKKKVDVYIINYDGLGWLAEKILSKEVNFDVLVVDESSKMRNTDSKRYKILKLLLAKFHRRYILTGTPQPKTLLNLFGQMYICDFGVSLGKFITHFRAKYFYTLPDDPKTFLPFPNAEAEIYKCIQHRIYHASDKDYLDLPPLFEHDIHIKLPDKARAMYKQMEDDFFLKLLNNQVVAANAAVASGKLRQISNGFIYDENKKVEHLFDDKIEAFKDLIEELQGEPALIVYNFDADYERMNAVAPGVKFTGAKNPEEIKAAWDEGRIERLYIHPKSAGFGLNMQAQRIMIWFGITWDYEDYAQTIKRLHRQGQKREVHVYRLLTRGTIETGRMTRVLAEREAGQEKLFDHLKDYWVERQKLDMYKD